VSLDIAQSYFNMALSQAAGLVEKAIGHKDNSITAQDITNPGRDRKKYADPSGETMKVCNLLTRISSLP
jgi:hypothetical protein